MRDFINMEVPPRIEESDDGILIFEFECKTTKKYYVVADFKHSDGKGDRREIFYDENCTKNPIFYNNLIHFLCRIELYRGFSWEEARRMMG